MLLEVGFLGAPRLIDVLRRQTPHCGVVLVEQPRVSREHLVRPVPVAPESPGAGSPAARPPTTSQTGAEASGRPEKLSCCGSVRAAVLPFAGRCLLEDKISESDEEVNKPCF